MCDRALYAPLQVVLNPQPQLTDMPLKSYYRYALPSFAAPETVIGEEEGSADEEAPEEEGLLGPPNPPAAIFTGLPGMSLTGPLDAIPKMAA